jgi:hypothetical protein
MLKVEWNCRKPPEFMTLKTERASLELACVYQHRPNEKGIGQQMLFSLINIYV